MAKRPTISYSFPCTREESLVYERVAAELNANAQVWSTAKNKLHQSIIDAIQQNLALYSELSQQRANIIERTASEFPSVATTLEKEQRYKVSQFRETLSVDSGILLSYKLIGEDAPSFPSPRSLGPITDPPEAQEHHDNFSLDNHPRRAPSRNATTIPRVTRSHAHGIERAPIVSLHRATPNTAIPVGAAQLSSPALLKFTLQLPIRTPTVIKGNYWVFEYRTRVGPRHLTAFYTMRCPASCDEPVFSKNPLRQNRAVKHLKSCGQSFQNERDMVRRYARLVVADRKSKKVSRGWVRMHNSRLLANEERDLEEENIEL